MNNQPTRNLLVVLVILATACSERSANAADPLPNTRPPKTEADLRYWLGNMVWHHGFSVPEVRQATGLSTVEIKRALEKFDIRPETRPKRKAGDALLVLPYPGGRHPRIGFLEGAIEPQRETKISVFLPWSESDYVVVDVPEAIWSNLGLTYLAHTHVPTVWSKQNIELKKLEWNRRKDGTLDFKRRLPNGIEFGAKVTPAKDHVGMSLWLTNGTKETLTDMRVQNCVMLKSAGGFNQQNNDNKVSRSPYSAVKSPDGKRWIITAWDPPHRVWANMKCPCLHSDPKFSDAAPGKTVHLIGWLSFHEGADIDAEFDRIEKTGWRKAK